MQLIKTSRVFEYKKKDICKSQYNWFNQMYMIEPEKRGHPPPPYLSLSLLHVQYLINYFPILFSFSFLLSFTGSTCNVPLPYVLIDH